MEILLRRWKAPSPGRQAPSFQSYCSKSRLRPGHHTGGHRQCGRGKPGPGGEGGHTSSLRQSLLGGLDKLSRGTETVLAPPAWQTEHFTIYVDQIWPGTIYFLREHLQNYLIHRDRLPGVRQFKNVQEMPGWTTILEMIKCSGHTAKTIVNKRPPHMLQILRKNS